MYFWFYSNQISSFWPNNLTNNRLLQCEMPLDLSRATCQTFCWWWSCLYVKASVWKPLIFGSPQKSVSGKAHSAKKKFKLLPPPKKSFLVEGKIYFLQFGGFGVMMSNPDALNIMWHPSTCIQKKRRRRKNCHFVTKGFLYFYAKTNLINVCAICKRYSLFLS